MTDDMPHIRTLVGEYRLRFNGPAQNLRLYGWIDAYQLMDFLSTLASEGTFFKDADLAFVEQFGVLLREANPILDAMDELAARDWVLKVRRVLNGELDRLIIGGQSQEPDQGLLIARDENSGETYALNYRAGLIRQQSEMASIVPEAKTRRQAPVWLRWVGEHVVLAIFVGVTVLVVGGLILAFLIAWLPMVIHLD